jgi:putative transposase
MVNSLNRVSSRLLRIARPAVEKRDGNHVLWSPSYLAASCGLAPAGHYLTGVLSPGLKVRDFTARER